MDMIAHQLPVAPVVGVGGAGYRDVTEARQKALRLEPEMQLTRPVVGEARTGSEDNDRRGTLC